MNLKNILIPGKIKMIISDFDGIFTDGTGFVDINGNVSKQINFRDVLAIAIAIRCSIKPVIITGEKSGAADYLDAKFQELDVYQGIKNKLPLVKQIIADAGLLPEDVLYIGDDINDSESLLYCGVRLTVPNAHACVKELPGIIITESSGGQAVFREIIDALTSEKVKSAFLSGGLCQ